MIEDKQDKLERGKSRSIPVKRIMGTSEEEGLWRIAVDAYERLTDRTLRDFSRYADKIKQKAANYIHEFTRGRSLTQLQVNKVADNFLEYFREKIIVMKKLGESLEDLNSRRNPERLDRGRSAYLNILSDLKSKGEVLSDNPSRIIGEMALNVYNQNGLKAKSYEIRDVVSLVRKRTLYSDGKIISLEKQVEEIKSLENHDVRKERMNFIHKDLFSKISESWKIQSENPFETIWNWVEESYRGLREKLKSHPYKNEVKAITNSPLKRIFYNPREKAFSLERIFTPYSVTAIAR